MTFLEIARCEGESPTNPISPNFVSRNPIPGFMGLMGWEGFVGYPMPNPGHKYVKKVKKISSL